MTPLANNVIGLKTHHSFIKSKHFVDRDHFGSADYQKIEEALRES